MAAQPKIIVPVIFQINVTNNFNLDQNSHRRHSLTGRSTKDHIGMGIGLPMWVV